MPALAGLAPADRPALRDATLGTVGRPGIVRGVLAAERPASLGLATLSAADGVEAVQVATEHRPALIFMDVQMPRMDGITAACRIRKAMPGPRAAIVAVTAFPEVRHLPGFKAAAFDDFLVKPVELPVLRRAVEKWLREPGANGQAGAARA